MKLLILKENLKKGLDVVCKVITKSFSLPILSNILLDIEKNFLCLTATDLELAIKYWILVKTEKQGRVAVPAKFLNNLVSFLPEAQILLEEQNGFLNIACKGFNTRIKCLPSEDFPIIPQIPKEDFLEINIEAFSRGLAQVVENAALSQTRPELSGVYLSFQKEKLVMAATDSFRLAEKKLFFRNPCTTERTLILPQKTARELASLGSEKDQKMKIYFSSNQIMFEITTEELSHPELQITSRLIEGEYPNYQEIIPKAFQAEVVLARDKFLHHLKTASLFSGRINEVKLTLKPQEQKLEIFSQSQEVGESRSYIPCQIKGEDMAVSFNWRFLVDGVSAMQSKEIILGLQGQQGPAVLKPMGDPNFIYIAMPIKGTYA